MKKEAFTLTELLVVVVIIGVLSAVVLPKFNKVIESRRTAEAESVMRAVRNEQEMRCTLDQNYTTNKDKLAVWPKQDSANYTYALNAGGMSATRKDKDYTLEIKTYLDGGICCSGTYCSSLNKDYPLCDDYEATPNTKDCVPANVEEESGVEPDQEPEPVCEPTHDGQTTYQEDCPSPQVGSITYRWNVSACKYEVEEHCSVCSPTHNGQSSYTEDCPSPQVGSITYRWNVSACKYEVEEHCSACSPTHNGQSSYTEDCPSPQVGSITYRWNVSACKYEVEEHCSACSPTHNGQSTYTEDCPTGQEGSITYTWDVNTCTYEAQEHCSACSPTNEGKEKYYLNNCPSPQVGSGDIYTWNYETCSYDYTRSCQNSSENGEDSNQKCSCWLTPKNYYIDAAHYQTAQIGSAFNMPYSGSETFCSVSVNNGPGDYMACLICQHDAVCRNKVGQWYSGVFPGTGKCNFDCHAENWDSTRRFMATYTEFSCSCQ